MKLFSIQPKEPTHVRIAEGQVELVIVHNPKVAMLYVLGPAMDESAFSDMVNALKKQGYHLQVFQAAPV